MKPHVKPHKDLTPKKLLQLMRQLRSDVRLIAAHISPPIAPEEYATASYLAKEALTELDLRDQPGQDGKRKRQSILVPILLYDALLTSSIGGLAEELINLRKEPYYDNPRTDRPEEDSHPPGITAYGPQDSREETTVGAVRDQGEQVRDTENG